MGKQKKSNKKINSTLDMSYGNPAFLFPFWEKNKVNYKYYYKGLNYLKKNCIYDLEIHLRRLHNKVNNAVVNDKVLVIGNGATQLLNAIIHCKDKPVTANPPYFSRFPEFSELNDQPFYNETPYPELSTQIITIPNNPDNSINIDKKCPDLIYDLCYNWSHYIEPIKFDEDIMIFNLAKSTGHASTRIGWAWFRDKDLADRVSNYMEYTTGGVSVHAQNFAVKVLSEVIDNKKDIFKFGQRELKNRWKLINKCKFPFKILNQDGMFLWCKGNPPKNIKYISGESCGMTDEYFRLNIGCDNNTFKEF
ncbi:MAG TPA: hypothetical protein PKI46_08720, partial [Bacteroidales bacterium]|nr:hypothetical protein [Bacteroidales bacterium]